MSASIDDSAPPVAPATPSLAGRCLAALAPRPIAAVYFAMMLAGLAAGFWPEAIYPPRYVSHFIALPTLQTLAMAQAAFFLLAYPTALTARNDKPSRGGSGLGANVAESMMLLLISAPLYVLAAYFADATARDAVRTALFIAALCPLAWATASLVRGRALPPWAPLWVLTMIALALPGGYYLVLEFFSPTPATWVRQLAPVLAAWDVAASRQATWLPQPTWSWLLWPGIAGIVALARGALRG